MKEYTVTRKYRDAEYTIKVSNPNAVQKGVKQLVLDGKSIDGNSVPYSAGKHTVEVVLG